MMQAGALIRVYLDGSVLLSHAGIEMGQGLNTKMIQIASRWAEGLFMHVGQSFAEGGKPHLTTN